MAKLSCLMLNRILTLLKIMIYPSEFPFYSNKFPKKIIRSPCDSGTAKNSVKVRNDDNYVADSRVIVTASVGEEKSFWHKYCLSSTIHGLKYIVDKQLNFNERYMN